MRKGAPNSENLPPHLREHSRPPDPRRELPIESPDLHPPPPPPPPDAQHDAVDPYLRRS
ncbi:MAG TPA: hypothetical protein VGR02_22070 [Thermoanaerobaculia bacterium]|jgi:hypothetical protein|nr:hypothetical protein [Thermoanaerobaculia bacterium]